MKTISLENALIEERLKMFGVALNVLHHPEDAKDAVQEACQKAIVSHGNFRGESSLSTWLHSITRNTSINIMRSRMRRWYYEEPETDLHQINEIVGDEPTPLEILTWDERREMMFASLNRAMGKLSSNHREVLVLLGEGMKMKEIAEILGIPLGTVQTRIYHGRRKLALLMDGALPFAWN